MMGTADRLVYMANQIARNLEIQGFDTAARGVADHIAAYWDPRMKAQLLAMDGPPLDPVGAEALRILRSRQPASPEKSAAPIASGGSDAG
jgi:formate dehydrogenase subunit delta